MALGVTWMMPQEDRYLYSEAKFLDKNTIWLHLNYDKGCDNQIEQQLSKLVQKRATDYPLEYIIKKVSFFGEIFFKVINPTTVPITVPKDTATPI